VFGAGDARKKEEWRSLIRQLVAAGFLSLDVKGFGGLTITAKGQDLIEGQEAFHYRPDTMRPVKSSRRKGRAAQDDLEFSADEEALFAKLKDLRLRLAKQRDVPAYVIFSDRSLADMARQRPRNDAEFAEINGVGAAKLKQFAAPFLEAIAAG
jgi:ATP-dependent DNA helicase RecQ